jgi:hypothetical protein
MLACRAARCAGGAALRHPDHPAQLGLPVGPVGPPHVLDRRRHGRARGGRAHRRGRRPGAGNRVLAGPLAQRARLRDDRPRRRRLGHVAAGAAGHRHRPPPPPGRRNDHLADDDPRHRAPRSPWARCWTPTATRGCSRSSPSSPRAPSCSPARPSGGSSAPSPPPARPRPHAFLEGLREIWGEPDARRFTIFVFLSMTAYFMQELILEPYAGLVFGFTPGQSTARCRARRTAASCSA